MSNFKNFVIALYDMTVGTMCRQIFWTSRPAAIIVTKLLGLNVRLYLETVITDHKLYSDRFLD